MSMDTALQEYLDDNGYIKESDVESTAYTAAEEYASEQGFVTEDDLPETLGEDEVQRIVDDAIGDLPDEDTVRSIVADVLQEERDGNRDDLRSMVRSLVQEVLAEGITATLRIDGKPQDDRCPATAEGPQHSRCTLPRNHAGSHQTVGGFMWQR